MGLGRACRGCASDIIWVLLRCGAGDGDRQALLGAGGEKSSSRKRGAGAAECATLVAGRKKTAMAAAWGIATLGVLTSRGAGGPTSPAARPHPPQHGLKAGAGCCSTACKPLRPETASNCSWAPAGPHPAKAPVPCRSSVWVPVSLLAAARLHGAALATPLASGGLTRQGYCQ